MNDGRTTIREMFAAERCFEVPDYQRAYAWQEPQLREFLEDLGAPMQGRPYFMGTFLLAEAGDLDGVPRLHVVDGQQRLTTIVLFMLAVIDRFMGDPGGRLQQLERRYIRDGAVPKLRTISADNAFFQGSVLTPGSAPSADPETPSQRRLVEARSFLREHVRSLTADELEQRIQRLENTRALTYVVHDSSEAALIFETTNDRGKRLTDLESIKSFLMFQMVLGTKQPTSGIEDIRSHFGSIYRIVERMDARSENLFGEDQILRHHFVAFETWKGDEDSDVKRSMKARAQRLLLESPDAATEHCQRVARELHESFRQAEEVLYQSDDVPGMEGLLAQRRLGSAMPLLIKARKLDPSPDKQSFARTASLLEVLTFRTHAFAGRRSDAGESRLASIARDFKGDFPSLWRKLVSELQGYCTNADIERSLSHPRLYETWWRNDLYYFFWCYENSLRSQQWRLPRTVAFRSENRLAPTVEHVWPQTPDQERWQVGEPMPDEHRETHLHALGNLTIAPKSLNSAMKNLPYDEKATGFFRRAPLACQNELDDFLESGRWTTASIERRTEHLIAFALRRWDPTPLLPS